MTPESPAKKKEVVERDFMGCVAHELKSPITAIRGSVQVLLDGGMADTADARRFLDIIAKQADRANAIIEDLLTLAQVEPDAGRINIARARTAIGETVEAGIEACEVQALQSNARVNMQCEQGLSANVNRRLLEQAVTNLIDNAIKYGHNGGAIEVQARQSGDEVVISVRDEGCGIPEEHLPAIFDRFYRVDKARSRELGGTGLGLAIVKRIAELHGGYPTVESVVGEGCVFAIHLPKA